MRDLNEDSSLEEEDEKADTVVVGGRTIRIKHSVKVRLIRELESLPTVLNEIKSDVIFELVLKYIEILVANN